jgi:hypothetical protein
MAANIYKKQIVEEFVNELGKLFSIRIAQYIRKFRDNDEGKFINEFIICPPWEFYDEDLIRYAALARKDFEENLNIKFCQFDVTNVAFRSDKFIEYYFAFFPHFLDEENDEDYLRFSVVGNKITFRHQSMIDCLESYEDADWRSVILKVQNELILGTMKSS